MWRSVGKTSHHKNALRGDELLDTGRMCIFYFYASCRDRGLNKLIEALSSIAEADRKSLNGLLFHI